MPHTGTAKHLCLSLSTRSMTAACGDTSDVTKEIPKKSDNKSSSRFTSVVPERGHRYPGATALKWHPKAVGFLSLDKDQMKMS